MRVRRATQADAEVLAALSGQLGYPCSTEDVRGRLLSILGQDDHEVLVAEHEGAVLGWVHVFGTERIESGRFAEIGGVVVDAARRGRGTGAALMRAAESWASMRGYPAVRLRSNVARPGAHQFFERQGYASFKRQAVFAKALAPESETR